jgi:hypothetical protein
VTKPLPIYLQLKDLDEELPTGAEDQKEAAVLTVAVVPTGAVVTTKVETVEAEATTQNATKSSQVSSNCSPKLIYSKSEFN